MAAGDMVYGTRTVLANVSRLDGDANNYATAFGKIDNTSTLALDYHIHLKLAISSSATTGTYDLYLVESQDGSEWTDGIDPATDTDYADFVKDAKFIKSMQTVYDNSPTGARVYAEIHFNITDIVPFPPAYFGFVRVNKSGQTTPSSTTLCDGDSQSIKIATS